LVFRKENFQKKEPETKSSNKWSLFGSSKSPKKDNMKDMISQRLIRDVNHYKNNIIEGKRS
jgi:hypothetical protein